jgi:hypothetical protein
MRVPSSFYLTYYSYRNTSSLSFSTNDSTSLTAFSVVLSSSSYLFLFLRLESIYRSNLLLQSLGRNFSLSAEDAERARDIGTGLQHLHRGFSNLLSQLNNVSSAINSPESIKRASLCGILSQL